MTNAEVLRVLMRRLVTDEELSAAMIADLRREGARQTYPGWGGTGYSLLFPLGEVCIDCFSDHPAHASR